MGEQTAGLKIGEVAQQAGVGVETIRYYERRGLLPEPVRSVSNYRLFPEKTVPLVCFLRDVQALGFSLPDAAQLWELREGTSSPGPEAPVVLAGKLQEIGSKMESLRKLREQLWVVQVELDNGDGRADGPLLRVLDGGLPAAEGQERKASRGHLRSVPLERTDREA